jgi:hypothetical protein
MNKEDLNTLTGKVYIIGVGIPVLMFHVLTTIVVLIVFRFDGEMMLLYLYAALIATAIAVPPAVVFLVARTKKIRRILIQAGENERQRGDYNTEEYLGIIDGFPLFMAMVAFVAAFVAVITETLFFYFLGDYNGLLSIVFIAVGLAVAIATAYIEFFVQYKLMEQARKAAYIAYGQPEYKWMLSMRARVIALPMILTFSILIVGWAVAMVNSILSTQENMLQRGLDNLSVIVENIDADSVTGWK